MILSGMLRRLVRVGELVVTDARGRTQTFRGSPGPRAAIRFADRATEWRVLLRPDPALGEAFMDGRLVLEEGSLYDFMDLCGLNLELVGTIPGSGLFDVGERLLRRFHQYNPIPRARANVAHHYDLSERLYELFLDRDRQYSCAYFEHPDADLDEAQLAKKRHLAAKLLLRPGQTVLDIGSGWGGLGLYLAGSTAVDVTGLTLSTEQLKVANDRAARAGLGARTRFLLKDYREMTGQFDRIVSVGMFEHVGINHYGTYFAKLRELLKPDGVAVLHSIGRAAGPSSTSAWIRKYIFPGGYIPSLSEVLPAVERQGLWVTDIEILRLHYAETLRHWRQRFLANREQIRSLFDERFCRMWEFYLVASELFFRRRDGMVFQMQLARRRDAVPLTRDYIGEWERRHRGARGIAA
jgi:cyclopropane-fatty-acyl-phospholipid synthase